MTIELFSVLSRMVFGGVTSLQWCNRCILSPSRLDPWTLVRRASYPSTKMQSVYSTVPATLAPRHKLWGFNPHQRCGRCILQSPQTGPQDKLWGWVLVVCLGGVDEFYSPSTLGHRTLIGDVFLLLQRYKLCIPLLKPTRRVSYSAYLFLCGQESNGIETP